MSTAKFTSAAKIIKALVGFVSEPNSKLFSVFCVLSKSQGASFGWACGERRARFSCGEHRRQRLCRSRRDCPARCQCSKKTACSRRSVLRNKSKKRLCDETIGAENGFSPPRPRQSGARPPVQRAFAVSAVRSANLTVDSGSENTPKLYFNTVFAAKFESRSLTFCDAEPSAK